MDNNTSMEKENFFTNGKQKITPIEIGREMQDSFLQYAMSVIVALPDVRDGLKPVHRRILYTMFEKGLTVFKKVFVIVSLNSNILVSRIVIVPFPTIMIILYAKMRKKSIVFFYD